MNRYLIATILSMLMLIFIMPNMVYSMPSNDTNLISEIGSSSLDQAIGNWRYPIDEGVHEAKPAHVHQFIPTNDPISLSESAPQAVLSGTITIKGRAMYRRLPSTTLVPMRKTIVELMDDDLGPDESVAKVYTDYNGYYTFVVNNDDGILQGGRDPYVKIWSENTVAYCENPLFQYYIELPKCGDDVSDGFYYDYGTWSPTSSNEAWLSIDACLTERDWVYSRSSWQIPNKIEINWPYGDWPDCHGDEIDLPVRSASTLEWTRFDVYHEYAHCIMYALYGHWPPGDMVKDHSPWTESNPGFAMIEGWAEFMECMVEGTQTFSIESNAFYNSADTGDMDGASVEGSVASILWDICDPVSAADKDSLSRPFNDVFAIIRYNQPDDINQFWNSWKTRYPDLTTRVGPLCTIYWHYGIDKDTYIPYGGSVVINNNAIYTISRAVTLTLKCSDWGSGVLQMRFADTRTWSGSAWVYTWGAWKTYSTSASWTLSLGDGLRTVYAQFKDTKGLISAICSDSITLDTIKPLLTGLAVSPSPFPYQKKMFPTPPLVRTVFVSNHTHINFTLSEPCYVTIKIYNNATGYLYRTLLGSKTQTLPAGTNSIEWDGKRSDGRIVPIGTYKIQIYVKDKAGNLASQSPYVTYVSILYVDTTSPVVTGVSVSPPTFPYAVTQPYQQLIFVGNHTHINFTLSEPCYVTIKIYNNATGSLCQTLLGSKTQTLPAGANSIVWYGTRADGTLLPVGVYRIQIYVLDTTGNGASSYPIKLYVVILRP